jgi:hypothetical protein
MSGLSGLDESDFTDAQRSALNTAARRSAEYLQQLRRQQCDVFCHGDDTTAGRYDAWRDHDDDIDADRFAIGAHRWPIDDEECGA